MKMNRTMNAISVALTVTFTLSTSGTLAHAKNAWQRSQVTTRLAERQADTAFAANAKIAAKLQEVVNRWDQDGAKIEKALTTELDSRLRSFADDQAKALDRLNPTEAAQLEADFAQLAKSAAQSGNVALAEKLEAAQNHTSEGTVASLRRFVADATYTQMKDKMTGEIAAAGSVKSYFEEGAQKLVTQKYASVRVGYYSWAILLMVVDALVGLAGVGMVIAAIVASTFNTGLFVAGTIMFVATLILLIWMLHA